MARGILLFGANGAGKSTIGRALARALGFTYFDIENYSFFESEIPYLNPRPVEEARTLLLADIQKPPFFVVSAVTPDLGNGIIALLELAVLISVPTETRVERVKQRSIEKFGERVQMGGDMAEQEMQFLNFIATRSVSKIEQWTQRLSCPVIQADGTKPILENVKQIAEQYQRLAPNMQSGV
jgi:adenylate kinase family enzyme